MRLAGTINQGRLWHKRPIAHRPFPIAYSDRFDIDNNHLDLFSGDKVAIVSSLGGRLAIPTRKRVRAVLKGIILQVLLDVKLFLLGSGRREACGTSYGGADAGRG